MEFAGLFRRSNLAAVAFLSAAGIGAFVVGASTRGDKPSPAEAPPLSYETALPATPGDSGPDVVAAPFAPQAEVTRVTTAAYVPLAGARTVDELTPWSEGGAVVTILGEGETVVRGSERRPATEDDVARASAAGKPLKVGQMIGPHGYALTFFPARIEWLSGETEEWTVVGQGGFLEPGLLEVIEGLPPFEPGRTYLFFLHRTDTGLVPQAIQFELVDGRLQPWSYPGSPLSRAWVGRPLVEVAPEIERAYTNKSVTPTPDAPAE